MATKERFCTAKEKIKFVKYLNEDTDRKTSSRKQIDTLRKSSSPSKVVGFIKNEIDNVKIQFDNLIDQFYNQTKASFESRYLQDNICDLESINQGISKRIVELQKTNIIFAVQNSQIKNNIKELSNKEQEKVTQIKQLDLLFQNSNINISGLSEQLNQMNNNLKHLENTFKLKTDLEIKKLQSEVNENGLNKLIKQNFKLELEENNLKELFQEHEYIKNQLNIQNKDIKNEIECTLQAIVSSRIRKELLVSEVKELKEHHDAINLKKLSLINKKCYLKELESDFGKLRISYAERLNEVITYRNKIVDQISKDNRKIDYLENQIKIALNQHN